MVNEFGRFPAFITIRMRFEILDSEPAPLSIVDLVLITGLVIFFAFGLEFGVFLSLMNRTVRLAGINQGRARQDSARLSHLIWHRAHPLR